MSAWLSWFKLALSRSCAGPKQLAPAQDQQMSLTSLNQQTCFKTYLASICWIFQQGMLCFQLCGNSLGKAVSIPAWLCFSAQSKVHNDMVNWMSLTWKNLTGPDRTLTSTPSNTFGMNWNGDCEPGFLVQHHCSIRWMGKKIQLKNSKILWKAFPEKLKLISAKGDELHINVYVFRMQCH